MAQARDINVMGALGVLLLAKRSGLLAEVGTHLNALRAAGFRMDRRLSARVKALAGEGDT